MVPLTALWLPILLSAVAVFIASSIIHMAPLWHRKDFPAPPDQDRVLDALRPLNIPPGDYMIPRASGTVEMRSAEFKEKVKQGPVVVMTVMPPDSMNMGRNLTMWLIYCVAVSLFAGYVAGRALGRGAEYLDVFRFAGTTAFIGYALALWQNSIWYKRDWRFTAKETIDGLIYGLVTAGMFGWLWPR